MTLESLQLINIYNVLQILRDRAVFYAGCQKRAILCTQGNYVESAIESHLNGNSDFAALDDHTALIERLETHKIAKTCAMAMRDVAYSVYNPAHIPDQFMLPTQHELLADNFFRQTRTGAYLESFPQLTEPDFNILQNNYRAIITRIRFEAYKCSRETLDDEMSIYLPEAAKNYILNADHSRNRISASFEMQQKFRDVMTNPVIPANIKIYARAIRNAALSAVNNAGGVQEWLMSETELEEAANGFIDTAMNGIPTHPIQPRPPQLK